MPKSIIAREAQLQPVAWWPFPVSVETWSELSDNDYFLILLDRSNLKFHELWRCVHIGRRGCVNIWKSGQQIPKSKNGWTPKKGITSEGRLKLLANLSQPWAWKNVVEPSRRIKKPGERWHHQKKDGRKIRLEVIINSKLGEGSYIDILRKANPEITNLGANVSRIRRPLKEDLTLLNKSKGIVADKFISRTRKSVVMDLENSR